MTNKSEKALEALLAFTYLADPLDNLTDEEAEALFNTPAVLSPELEAAADKWVIDIDKLLDRGKP